MIDVPETRSSLLLCLRDAENVEAWNQFIEVYLPLIHQFARRRGLQDADAADVTQEVLRQVASSMREFNYDRDRGRFRSWLFAVTRTRIYNHLSRQRLGTVGSGDTGMLERLSEQPAAEEEVWNHDLHQRLFAVAMQRAEPEFRASSWQAFRRTAIDGEAASSVAAALDMSTGAVYVAKSRVLARLREIVQELDDDSFVSTGARAGQDA
jgi:RNA polymerase sigma-70 factor (ECF subfamily)